MPRTSETKEVEWEYLPPGQATKNAAKIEPLFRWIALIMDEVLRLPGTRLRFGIDPIVGLIPGIGDTGSAIVSAIALVQAARYGVPKIILARMSVNILLNELIGIVPIVGDAFSFWFKSNTRNYDLLKQHMGVQRKARTADWVFVVAVLLALAVIVAAGIAVSLLVIQQIIRLATAR